MLDFDYLIDTTCYELTLRLSNSSVNANAYFWDFDQGDTSNLDEPVVTFPNLGTYEVMLVAIDTVCDSYDTTYITIEHDTANFPTALWTPDYVSCDLFKEVVFTESLGDADYFEFNFGDGTTLVTSNQTVQHAYLPRVPLSLQSLRGIHSVMLAHKRFIPLNLITMPTSPP